MPRRRLLQPALAVASAVLVVGAGCGSPDEVGTPEGVSERAGPAVHDGLLHGRVTMADGTVYEGRLRWGGDEEALWAHYFNGYRPENPWAEHVREDDLPKERSRIEVFGLEIGGWERRVDLGRPFMVRMGDITRIDARGRGVRVTLKSGTTHDLDRFSADDLADGLRVWDEAGIIDLGEWRIRSVELFAGPAGDVGSAGGTGGLALHGTVETTAGDFTGLVQWDREQSLRTDELRGRDDRGALAVPFDSVRSIERSGSHGARVTLLDGPDVQLTGVRGTPLAPRGIYVDDPRFGRVLVSWEAFERVDFTEGGRGPAYGDFPPGRALTGTVVTRSGHRLTGRIVFDLDESETTQTLDAPWQGVDYTIPFGLVAAIDPARERGASHVSVTLTNGEALRLEPGGDLGASNAGILVFSDGSERAEYTPWLAVERIVFDRAEPRDGAGATR